MTSHWNNESLLNQRSFLMPSAVTLFRYAAAIAFRLMAFRSLLLALVLCAGAAHGAEVSIGVVGLFPGKAVLVIDNAAPKTYAVGASVAPGVLLAKVDTDSAGFDLHGKRQTIALGAHMNRTPASNSTSVTLQADGRGHFMAEGQINGGTLRMLVDTGATLIALPAQDAQRLGIPYKKGERGMVNTANGPVPVYRVRLDSVKIGDIVLNQVDAVIQENGLPYALLGMSFLKRTEMRRDGEQLTLTKRF
jgi:aspartyl protease family protein